MSEVAGNTFLLEFLNTGQICILYHIKCERNAIPLSTIFTVL